MIAYLDSSVILRKLLGEPDPLAEWASIDRAVVSALVEVECSRTLDRLRHVPGLSDEVLGPRYEALQALLRSCEVVALSRAVLSRAAQPLPLAVGTLDAIHLAAAMSWRDWTGVELVMATHDTALARVSRAMGLAAVGLPAVGG